MSTPTSVPALPWLVVIDMQAAFADPASAGAVPGYAPAEKWIRVLTPGFEERVVYTRFVPDPAEHGAWGAYYDHWPTMRQPASSSTWDLTLETTSAPVVSLPTFSKWGPGLGDTVGAHTPLVLCGVATDCCVLSTGPGAVDAGRAVTVVEDACAGVSRRHHEETISLLSLLAPMVTITNARSLM